VTSREKCDAVVIAVLAVTIALAGAAAGRAISAVGLNFAGGTRFTWYLRLRLFDVTTEVLILGVLSYALPRTRLTAIASRVAAVLALIGIASEVGEWSLEGGNRFLAAQGGAFAGALTHVGVLFALGSVVALWFVSSAELGAPDLA
jgi:hypothetical protein